MQDNSHPEQITRQSGSNLALAFILLPKDRRRDITVFYAFCRLIDDLVDAPERSVADKQRGLQRWRELIFSPTSAPASGEGNDELAPAGLAGEIRQLIEKYLIPPHYFEELIAGVEMDLQPARYATWVELRHYCYRVASVVGLISIEIFGYRNPRTRDYAVTLGYALQLTNIIRDVAKDTRMEFRVYLPADDLARHGVTESALLAGRPESGFTALMAEQTARARALYAEARALLPREDRQSLIAAELMRMVYSRLLDVIAADGFRVFERDYKLSRAQKLSIIAQVYLRKILRR